jgi:hypothetical protein
MTERLLDLLSSSQRISTMRRLKLGWLCGITVLGLAGGLTALGAVLKHEPNFYCQNQVPPSSARTELAYAFARNFSQMMLNRKQECWGCDASEAQLNCFFDEIFVQRGEAEDLSKLGISSPSVTLEDDHIRLAFRYGSGWFSTVISYDLRIWLVPKEANVIAVEIQSARAGALPISKQSILHQLSEIARKQNFKVTLYRHEGNSVALIDLQGDQQQPKSILTTLKVTTNKLTIRGKTLGHALGPPDLNKGAKIVPLP